MKFKFWLFGIFSLLIVNLAWIWRTDQDSKEYAQRMNDNRDRFIQTSRELYLMKRGWEFTMKSNEQRLPERIWIKHEKDTLTMLDHYVGPSSKLVLVLSDRHCSTCVDQLLFILKNEFPEIQRGNILVLYSSSGKDGEQWTHRQKILPGVNFLEIRDKSLRLPMDSLEIPYFFVTGRDHLAAQSYTPYPALELQTKAYLKLMVQRYFN
ncbi:MAG: hypothetical protein WCW62_04760 [Bacteroidales bacterium]